MKRARYLWAGLFVVSACASSHDTALNGPQSAAPTSPAPSATPAAAPSVSSAAPGAAPAPTASSAPAASGSAASSGAPAAEAAPHIDETNVYGAQSGAAIALSAVPALLDASGKPLPQTTDRPSTQSQTFGARMALLDARAPSDYINQHIAGAVSVPFYDPTPYLAKLPKNSWLVCYCACPHAESGSLADRLLKAGFKKVTVLDEGLGAWAQKKYPVSSGEKP